MRRLVRVVSRAPTPGVPSVAALHPPPGLVALRLDALGAEFELLEWPARPGRRSPLLTPAEADVVEAAMASLTNGEIARALGRATRTVANELAAAYAKLGVGSRAELAAWLSRRPGETA